MNACFLLNSLSFVVVINTLMALHVQTHSTGNAGGMRDELRNGLSYVRHHGTLVGLTVLAAATTFLGFAVLTFLPLFAQQVFQQGREHLQPSDGVLGRRVDCGRAHVAWLGKFKRMGLTALLMQIVYGVLIIAFAMSRVLCAQRSAPVPHRLRADDRVLHRHVARAAHCAQRDARPRHEHLHAGVPRRNAAWQPGLRMAGAP